MVWFYKISAWLRDNWHYPLIWMVAIIFFLGVSVYNYLGQANNFVKWTSPDETANYQLAKQYGQNNKLMFLEKYNLIASGVVQPRSLTSDGIWLKPVSFLGLPVFYGWLSRIFGTGALPYMTPAFAAIGLLLYYGLIRRIFDKSVALDATLLLAVFPIYVYYSAHSFFHNTLFVVMCLAGLYFGVRALDRGAWSWLAVIISGSATALAVATRTSELLWLLPVGLMLFIFYGRRLGWYRCLLWLIALFISYSPFLYNNLVLYGGFFSSGYPQMDKAITTIALSSAGLVSSVVSVQKINLITQYWNSLVGGIFHFGFRPEHSLKMVYYYFWRTFPWLMYLTAFGIIYFAFGFKNRAKKHLAYFLSMVVLSLILIFYYGSWIFYDNPDPNSFTIGNSYTRYWLPIYLGLLPLAALALNKLIKVLVWPKVTMLLRIGVFGVIMALSLSLVVYGSEEGLAASYYRLRASQTEYDQVLALTENDSVIISRYHDKLLWPERRVIVGLFTDANMNEIYARLAEYIPVYYYNFSLKESDLDYLNLRPLAEVGLNISKVKEVTADFTLYKLSLTDNLIK